MKCVVLLALLVCTFLVHNCVSIDEWQGRRNPSAIADDIYEALIKIVEGEPQPLVKERTKAQRTTSVQYWRADGKITIKEGNGKKILYFQGRRMLRTSEINKLVGDEFDRTKGSGAAKLVCSLRENYVGLSRVRVQNILNSDKKHFRRNAKFLNKATKKPIHARDVQVRYQIDLMDMGKTGVVKMNVKSYRYVLSVIDVFSCFAWLRALTTKCSKDIS